MNLLDLKDDCLKIIGDMVKKENARRIRIEILRQQEKEEEEVWLENLEREKIENSRNKCENPQCRTPKNHHNSIYNPHTGNCKSCNSMWEMRNDVNFIPKSIYEKYGRKNCRCRVLSIKYQQHQDVYCDNCRDYCFGKIEKEEKRIKFIDDDD